MWIDGGSMNGRGDALGSAWSAKSPAGGGGGGGVGGGGLPSGKGNSPSRKTPQQSPYYGSYQASASGAQRIRSTDSDDDDDDDDANNTDPFAEEFGILGFSEPFTFSWCFSVIGSEYVHTYFWVAKDLSWTQGWRFFALFYGSLAIFWWLVIAYHALRTCNRDEIYNCVALFLWLFANFWWMTGEAHDYAYPDSPELSDIHTEQCARILETALIWLAIYYLIILPFDLMPVSDEAVAEYDDGSLKPRFSYFKNFRQ
jgi:hypothetical protein